MGWCVLPSHSPRVILLVFAAEAPIAHSSIAFAFGIAFTVLMGIAAALDVRHRRIPNSIVVLILSLGTLYLMMGLGFRAGAVRVIEGSTVGLLIWLPVWIIGKMGAGDVKFFAASAAWQVYSIDSLNQRNLYSGRSGPNQACRNREALCRSMKSKKSGG